MSMPEELTPEEARADHWHMLRFLAGNALFGFALGLSIAGAMIAFDLGGLGSRIVRSQHPWLVCFILATPLAFTFSGAVTASAVMLMPYKRKKDRG
ncbi:hypothetical protein SAMN05880590_111144 [Rhizobium sp. RU35A]|uniref:Uncharacterized protein n=1 Tax=Rhizobium straminoryzae TaxID=1387186 RepID=A0A549T3V8_9HYPH|nr:MULTISPECIES: hypothetical protein [Rhizobium]TRL36502.1 hypothetical protein FNA46_17795 [Rhizobium straminoryzae]SIR07680.1 hypothetical protein SAMN05880590_111144 [Rhizobium sp. RU35A]